MIRNIISEFRDANFKYDHLFYENLDWSGIELQAHTGYEMIYLKSGEVTYIAGEKIFNVKPGNIILTPPGTSHIIDFNEKIGYDRFDIIFDATSIPSEIYDALPPGANVFCTENPEYFLSLFEKLDFYCSHFSDNTLKKILINVVEEIFYNIVIETKKASSFVSFNHYTTDSNLAKAIEYINRNINNKFSLESMCEELFVSKSYIHKIFARYTQTTPKKYINSKRLSLAHQEICSGSKPTEIYLKYGFSDYSSFYRSYKSFYGHSPSENQSGV